MIPTEMQTLETPSVATPEPSHAGTHFGIIDYDGKHWGLIVAPKAEGETTCNWALADVTTAGDRFDGMRNTDAMAEAGSSLAQWARSLRIGGHADWYIPSRYELAVLCRFAKSASVPEDKHRSYKRRFSLPMGYIYGVPPLAQMSVEAFRKGGAEAFAIESYWSSTQLRHPWAWAQYFGTGSAGFSSRKEKLRCRAVRKFPIL